LKILFCIDSYFPSRGGAERYLKDLGEALHERGHKIFVAAINAEDDGFSEQIIVKTPDFPRFAREFVFARSVLKLKNRAQFDRMIGFRHVLGADLFQPHEGLFIDSIKGALRPYSSYSIIKLLLFLKKLLSLKNLFFLYADRALFKKNPDLKVAALSIMTANSINERHGTRKITVIPNGVDTTRFNPDLRKRYRVAIRETYAVPHDVPLLLFAAHNFKLKGLRQGLEGMAKYIKRGKNCMLLVAGKGKKKQYRSIIEKLGLTEKVIFAGSVNDMAPLLGAADLLLHPTFYDPCSLVVLEALGIGTPVVTTKYNGASELLAGHGAGIVLNDPRKTNEIADALELILHPKKHPQYCSEAAKLGVRNDFKKHVDLMELWINGN